MLVFVYGTLKSDFINNDIMKDSGGRLISAGTTQSSWRLLCGCFPAVVPPEIEVRHHTRYGRVSGELYEVESMDKLDRLEGYDQDLSENSCLYLRKEINVELPNGSTAQAWIYYQVNPEFMLTQGDTSDWVTDYSCGHLFSYSWIPGTPTV